MTRWLLLSEFVTSSSVIASKPTRMPPKIRKKTSRRCQTVKFCIERIIDYFRYVYTNARGIRDLCETSQYDTACVRRLKGCDQWTTLAAGRKKKASAAIR